MSSSNSSSEPESEIISSFCLRRIDGKLLEAWIAGQLLPIRVTILGEGQPALSTSTLSTAPNPDHYRLSIQRGDGNAPVSRFLHANGKPGLRIKAVMPRGKFTRAGERPPGRLCLWRRRHYAGDRHGEPYRRGGPAHRQVPPGLVFPRHPTMAGFTPSPITFASSRASIRG